MIVIFLRDANVKQYIHCNCLYSIVKRITQVLLSRSEELQATIFEVLEPGAPCKSVSRSSSKQPIFSIINKKFREKMGEEILHCFDNEVIAVFQIFDLAMYFLCSTLAKVLFGSSWKDSVKVPNSTSNKNTFLGGNAKLRAG